MSLMLLDDVLTDFSIALSMWFCQNFATRQAHRGIGGGTLYNKGNFHNQTSERTVLDLGVVIHMMLLGNIIQHLLYVFVYCM